MLGVRQRSLLGSWAGLSAGVWDRVRGQDGYWLSEVSRIMKSGRRLWWEQEGQLESQVLTLGDRGYSLGSPSVWPSRGGVGGGREGPFPFLRLPGGGVGTIVAQTWPPVPPALANWRQPLSPRPQLSPMTQSLLQSKDL